ncbi:M23/M56 family metallopeptidase [Hyphobacterium sp.]|uniref:M23/M56 family metallopeptidase n=1 Tax=Hyphobacterium sp. TaxID=2004662 RepID=UPI003BAA8BA3
MTGFLNAVLLGSGLSLAAGGLIWAILSRFRMQPRDVASWRIARWASLVPILLSPMIYLLPERSLPAAASSAASHPVLSGAYIEPIPTVDPAVTAISLDANVWLILYFAGLTVALLAAVRRHVWRQRLVSSSRMPEPAERRLLATFGSVETPPIRISKQIASPVLSGWNGLVLLPESLLDQPGSLRFALLHEQIHFQRGDERDRLLGTALKTLCWFHLPLRWIERELNAARELACDAAVLNRLGNRQRKAYAETLIDSMRRGLPAASAFGPRDRRHRSMRIHAIFADTGESRFRAICFASASAAILCPFTVAQAAWTDRHAPLPRVEQVEPVAPTHPSAQPAPELAQLPDELPFGEPVPAPLPRTPENLPFGEAERPPLPPAPEIAEPAEVSFGPPDAPAPFVREPVVGGRLTSQYGPRPSRPADSPRFHGGTDIAAAPGTPILAPAGGRVVHAAYGFDDNEAWGNTVAIDHGEGWQTVYAHMQDFDVAVGDTVTAGARIGRVGSSGRSTGPHVHVEVRHNGERLDPEAHLPGLR